MRARVAVLVAIQTIARATPRLVQAHWSLLLPQSTPTGFDPAAPTLLSCLLYDPAARVREAAASTLGALLDGAPLQKLLPLPTPSSSRSRTSGTGAGAGAGAGAGRMGGSAGAAAGAGVGRRQHAVSTRRRRGGGGVTTMSERVDAIVCGVFVAMRRVLQPGIEPAAAVLTQALKVRGVWSCAGVVVVVVGGGGWWRWRVEPHTSLVCRP